jgi:hypothetical protein
MVGNQGNLNLTGADSLNQNQNLSLNQANLNDRMFYDPSADLNIDCIYYDETSFLQTFQSNENPIIFSLNIRSLMCNHHSLINTLNALSDTNVHFIALQEIWQIIDPGPVQIPGFKFIYNQREGGRRGGGVGIYVKEGYSLKILKENSIFVQDIFESLVIQVNIPASKKSIVIANYYRPNNHSDIFLEHYANFMDNLSNFSCDVFLVSDSNINLLEPEMGVVQNYEELSYAYGFTNIIKKATRIQGNSCSLIDHIYTKLSVDSIISGVFIDTPSDHFATFCVVPDLTLPKADEVMQSSRSFSKTKMQFFKESLQNLHWEEVLEENDPEKAYNNFEDIFFTLFNLHFPSTPCKKPNKNKNPIKNFMTQGLIISRKRKLLLAKEAKFSGLDSCKLKYQEYRNIYNRLVKLSKRLYYEKQLFSTRGCPRKQWNVLKEAAGIVNAKGENIELIISDGISISDTKKIADHFNTYFANIGVQTSESVPPSPVSFRSFLSPPPPNSFFMQPITEDDITKSIKQLQNKATLDINDVSVSLMKFVSIPLTIPLKHIFNLSISKGVFPAGLKLSKTSPIFKSTGSQTDPNNYRPISMINTFSKVLEKIIATKLITFLNQTNFFSDEQFGFRENRNTYHAVLKIINYITEGLNEKKFVAGIFLDISKAFDSVPHKILLDKLYHYGVRGVAHTWFKSYLSDRQQKVKVNGVFSSNIENIVIGVLQGSILGVLLFLIFINDLPRQTTSKFYNIIFADDTTALAKDYSLEHLVEFCNIELSHLNTWFNANKLLLN